MGKPEGQPPGIAKIADAKIHEIQFSEEFTTVLIYSAALAHTSVKAVVTAALTLALKQLSAYSPGTPDELPEKVLFWDLARKLKENAAAVSGPCSIPDTEIVLNSLQETQTIGLLTKHGKMTLTLNSNTPLAGLLETTGNILSAACLIL